MTSLVKPPCSHSPINTRLLLTKPRISNWPRNVLLPTTIARASRSAACQDLDDPRADLKPMKIKNRDPYGNRRHQTHHSKILSVHFTIGGYSGFCGGVECFSGRFSITSKTLRQIPIALKRRGLYRQFLHHLHSLYSRPTR
jgi:hypothetical protein